MSVFFTIPIFCVLWFRVVFRQIKIFSLGLFVLLGYDGLGVGISIHLYTHQHTILVQIYTKLLHIEF